MDASSGDVYAMITLAKTKLANLALFFFLLAASLPLQASTVTHVSVDIRGIDGRLLDNVNAYLQIANLDPERRYVNYQIRYLHRKAAAEIKAALQPFGYYQVDVDSRLTATDDGRWQASYQVTLNEPVTFAQTQWQIDGEGRDDEILQKLLANNKIEPGDTLIHSRYESIKSALLRQAIQRGYQNAHYKQAQITVDTERNSADLEVIFDTGPRYFFGELTVVDSHLDADLIRRYARFKQGAPYLNSELSRLQVDLGNSDYFSQVTIRSDWQNADSNQQVPVNVETQANEQTQYRYGIGYGTDTGVRLTAGLDRRWVNKQGHQFRSQLQLAQYESQATAIYHVPGKKPQMDYQQYRAEIGDKENDSLDSRLYQLQALDVYTYARWQREYNISLLREDFRIGDERDSSSFFVPGMEWRYLNADDRINVSNGWRLTLGLRGAAESVLSETNLLQGYAELKTVWSLTEHWRLLSRVEIGASYTDNFDVLPPSLRFFAGGDNSVRGYAYEQLGPKDDSGAVTGGKYLAVASAELDYRFADNWRVALFTDIGNSMIEPNQALKQSVGFGFRWISPVGAIRLDLAQAIDEPGDPWRLHFTLGSDL
ncbi:autotransporter assembly complex protein TamA [Idiomarina sp. OT37-5b]|uniref:autotransporter assembly complex protein TamA n=1 Tax=Idiomarina sp. OT37-5b TaxID=2100422 RepID=UPI0021CB1188|nr:autotransporter assembly complex family protein [Idiomarina sp. OT37-5b]